MKATQWFKNGDHPDDKTGAKDCSGFRQDSAGCRGCNGDRHAPNPICYGFLAYHTHPHKHSNVSQREGGKPGDVIYNLYTGPPVEAPTADDGGVYLSEGLDIAPRVTQKHDHGLLREFRARAEKAEARVKELEEANAAESDALPLFKEYAIVGTSNELKRLRKSVSTLGVFLSSPDRTVDGRETGTPPIVAMEVISDLEGQIKETEASFRLLNERGYPRRPDVDKLGTYLEGTDWGIPVEGTPPEFAIRIIEALDLAVRRHRDATP